MKNPRNKYRDKSQGLEVHECRQLDCVFCHDLGCHRASRNDFAGVCVSKVIPDQHPMFSAKRDFIKERVPPWATRSGREEVRFIPGATYYNIDGESVSRAVAMAYLARIQDRLIAKGGNIIG